MAVVNLLGQSPKREFMQSRLRERVRGGYTFVDLQFLHQGKVVPGYPYIKNAAWENYNPFANDPENPYGLIPFQAYADTFKRWAICEKTYNGGTYGTPLAYSSELTFEGDGNCPVISGNEPASVSRVGGTQSWEFQFVAAGGDKTILDTAPTVYSSSVTSEDLTSATYSGQHIYYPNAPFPGPEIIITYETASVQLSSEVPLWYHTARCCNRLRARQWWNWGDDNFTPGEVFDEYTGDWVGDDTSGLDPGDFSGGVASVGAFGDPVVPVGSLPYPVGDIYGLDGAVRYDNSLGTTLMGAAWWRLDTTRSRVQGFIADKSGVVAVRCRFRTRGVHRGYWMAYTMLVRYRGHSTEDDPEDRVYFDGYLPVVHNGSRWTLGVLKYKEGTTSSVGVEVDFPSPDISKQNSLAEIQSPAYAPVECDGENEEISLWINGAPRTFLLPKSFAVSAMTFAIMSQSVADWVARTKVPVIQLAQGDIEDITADDAWISTDEDDRTTDQT